MIPLIRSHSRFRLVSTTVGVLAIFLSLAACDDGAMSVDRSEDATRAVDLSILEVGVISVEGAGSVTIQDVHIDNGKIVAVAPPGSTSNFNPQTKVDGRGKFLIFGLSDMYTHVAEGWGVRGTNEHLSFPEEHTQEIADEMFLFVANGVTLVQNMDGWPLHLELRERVEDGRIIGPEMHLSGPIIYGPGKGALYPNAEAAPGDWADSPEAARQIVNRQIDMGFDFVRVYNSMSAETYFALVDEATQRGVKVAGLVPFDVGIFNVLKLTRGSIEHFRGYDNDPVNPPTDPMAEDRWTYWLKLTDEEINNYAALTFTSGVANVPTLAMTKGMPFALTAADKTKAPYYETMTPSLRAFNDRFSVFSDKALRDILSTIPQVYKMLRAMNDKGALLMTGTDTPFFYTWPGFGLHQELSAYVEAGLSPASALRASTLAPAIYMERSDTHGRIKAGYEADLVLLAANPLEDIRNTTEIEGVVLDGVFIPKANIDARLAQIRERYPLDTP